MTLRILDALRIAAKLAALYFLLAARFPLAWAGAAWMVSELLMEAYWLVQEREDEEHEEDEPPAKSSPPPARPHPRHPSSRPPAK